MGELIFSFAYGSALIVMGLVTRFFLKKMDTERSKVKSVDGTKSHVKYEKAV